MPLLSFSTVVHSKWLTARSTLEPLLLTVSLSFILIRSLLSSICPTTLPTRLLLPDLHPLGTFFTSLLYFLITRSRYPIFNDWTLPRSYFFTQLPQIFDWYTKLYLLLSDLCRDSILTQSRWLKACRRHCLWFLQDVSTASYAEPCISFDRVVRPSVRHAGTVSKWRKLGSRIFTVG